MIRNPLALKSLLPLLLLAVLPACKERSTIGPAVSGAPVSSFRFTATSDPHGYQDVFSDVASQIDSRASGAGDLHVTTGDLVDGAGALAAIQGVFGAAVTWVALPGNRDAAAPAQMTWLRAYNAVIPGLVRRGPAGSEYTTYSFDRNNAHFVVLNEYFDGVSETGADGDVGDALYAWLESDLALNTKPIVVVFGHEPAYPELFHAGDSLDQYPDHRDRFWALLESRHVAAYVCGHSHHRAASRPGGGSTWHVEIGTAGEDLVYEGYTFLDATVYERSVRFNIWSGSRTSMSPTQSFVFNALAGP